MFELIKSGYVEENISPLRLGPCGLSEYARRFAEQLSGIYDPKEIELTYLFPRNEVFEKLGSRNALLSKEGKGMLKG